MGVRRYRAAGGVVIDDRPTGSLPGPRMLLLERPSRGEVRLPKGHIDPGEEPLQAALRETREETGYAALEVLDDLGAQTVEFDHQGDRVIRDEHYYLLRLLSGQQIPRPPEDEAQFRVRWLPLEQAPQALTFAAEQEVARRAVQRYRALQTGS